MNILIAVEEYYPIGGGIQQYLQGLGKSLRAGGHSVSFLTKSIDGCPESEEKEEGTILRTGVLEGGLQRPIEVLKRWRELMPLIREISPDAVYTNNHASIAVIKASRELGIPVVYCCHGWGLFCPLKVRLIRPDISLCYNERSIRRCSECYKMLHGKETKGLRGVYHRLRVSLSARRSVLEKVSQYDLFQEILESADARIVLSGSWSNFFESDKTFSVPLGLDAHQFMPVPSEEFKKKYCIEGPYILVTSRIHDTKGQDWAIRSLAYLPGEMKLVIAGNSSLFTGPVHEKNMHTDRAKKIIEDLGLKDRVVFTGFLDAEGLKQAYSGAAATLVPSVWLEPFGYVTAEAMSCECPVVITRNCGSADLIRDGVEGYMVPRMDPKAMAEAVLKVILRRSTMGKAARERIVNDFNWSAISKMVLETLYAAGAGRRKEI